MATLTEGDHMSHTKLWRSAAPVAACLVVLLTTAACGNETSSPPDSTSDSGQDDSSSSAEVDTSAADGDWLLGLQTAGGADAESATTVYVTYNPATGQASARTLPPVKTPSAETDDAVLLVSSDRQWAIPDTEITPAEERSGQLKVYSLPKGDATAIDIRQRTGQSDVKAVGWAFDPQQPHTLRVVDTKNRVWAVDVTGGKATQEKSLATGEWFFNNGFNHATGEPYMESIENDDTNPAGNGVADTSPITRDGGTVLANDAKALTGLPPSPCRLGAAFVDGNGTTWAFCADKASLSTYYLPKDGEEWTAYGKPSTPVAPEAATFPLVLPPAS